MGRIKRGSMIDAGPFCLSPPRLPAEGAARRRKNRYSASGSELVDIEGTRSQYGKGSGLETRLSPISAHRVSPSPGSERDDLSANICPPRPKSFVGGFPRSIFRVTSREWAPAAPPIVNNLRPPRPRGISIGTERPLLRTNRPPLSVAGPHFWFRQPMPETMMPSLQQAASLTPRQISRGASLMEDGFAASRFPLESRSADLAKGLMDGHLRGPRPV